MIAGKSVWLMVVGMLVAGSVTGQRTKTQLQKEKERRQAEIRDTERILEETSEQKKASVGELSALNQRILQQEELIRGIKGEIGLLDQDIRDNNDLISSMEQDLNQLKNEYRKMLLAAQRSSGKIDQILFLFSAHSFDQMAMRLRYFEHYGAVRRDQTRAIRSIQQLLGAQVQQTKIIKNNKGVLLAEEENENQQLTKLKNQQRDLVRTLQQQEIRLRREYENTKKAIARLDQQIEAIIREEIARAEREARKRATAKKAPTVRTDAAVVLSSSFEENKKKLPWPTSGFVSQHFGLQNHPVLRGIVINNDGINIQTQRDAKVKCVFQGKVSTVGFTEGIGKLVIVNHGDYFTVYSGLRDVYVTTGQEVSTLQEIGQLNTNFEGFSELRFLIFKSTQPVDPQMWLSSVR